MIKMMNVLCKNTFVPVKVNGLSMYACSTKTSNCVYIQSKHKHRCYLYVCTTIIINMFYKI